MSGESGHSDEDDGEKLALKEALVIVGPDSGEGASLANERWQ